MCCCNVEDGHALGIFNRIDKCLDIHGRAVKRINPLLLKGWICGRYPTCVGKALLTFIAHQVQNQVGRQVETSVLPAAT